MAADQLLARRHAMGMAGDGVNALRDPHVRGRTTRTQGLLIMKSLPVPPGGAAERESR